jgi:glycosyltransferase involved in cell wall biosynthesis
MPDRLPRIAIDLEKLRHINCGLGRFSLHLAGELLRLAPDRFRPVFFLAKGTERHFPAGGFDQLTVTPWKKESLRRLVRPLARPFLPPPEVDLWHSTNQMSKYLPLDARVPLVLTIHDLNFLHESPHDEHGWLRRTARKLADVQQKIDRSTAIVADSRFVADDVAAHLDLRGRTIDVVPLGLSAPVVAATERPPGVPGGDFLLSLGNCLAHKNFHTLLGLMERLPNRRLVIAGKNATPYGEFLRSEIARLRLQGRVSMLGEVSDADRQWLYEHCEAFLFPSLAEGFGFPVLEAMQCGKPVFMARKTCLPEVAGNHGFYFDSFEPAAMMEVLEAGLRSCRADAGFADRVRAHAATYSWQATARGYVAIYERVLREILPKTGISPPPPAC